MDNARESERIIETVNRLFIYTDNRDWPKVEALFAPRVLFDMTSLAGRQPETTTHRAIVDGRDNGFRTLKAVHHQAGNLLVDIKNNEASVFFYGIAMHYLPHRTNRNTRTFVGSYDIHLEKQNEEWKIDRFRFNLKFIDGNAELEKS